MRITASLLQRYLPNVPLDPTTLRDLLDDVGIEVKRVSHEEHQTYFDLELLANRGDHRSIEGIARELYGRLGGVFKSTKIHPIDFNTQGLNLTISTDKCYAYSLTAFTLDNPKHTLSQECYEILTTAGIESKLPVIDVTNVVNLEIGQPLHAFDADKIKGGIVIRDSAQGEQALLLFASEPITLPTGTLVVADHEKILAVAGVMGCQGSEVTEATQRIYLESAAFDPVAVRLASRALGIMTDSSQRFERGSDISSVKKAAERAVAVLKEANSISRISDAVFVSSGLSFERTIDFNKEQLDHYFEHNFDVNDVIARLERVGFSAYIAQGVLTVQVPCHRYWDVENKWDIFEELAKSYSYSVLPEVPPEVSSGALPTPQEVLEASLREHFVSNGFYEIFTDAFYGKKTRDKLIPETNHSLWKHVETLNAIDRDYSLIKNNCLAQALETVEQNLKYSEKQFRFFELTKTFHKSTQFKDGLLYEKQVCWGIMLGNASNDWVSGTRPYAFWDAKGLIDSVSRRLKIQIEFFPGSKHPVSEFLHPLRKASIALNNQAIGVLGEVHPEVLTRFGIKREKPYYFEISVEALLRAEKSTRSAKEPSVRAPSVRMLNFVLPLGVEASSIIEVLKKDGPDWLERIAVKDVFTLTDHPHGTRSVTFELAFENEASERSSEDVNDVLLNLAKTVESTFVQAGVSLRA